MTRRRMPKRLGVVAVGAALMACPAVAHAGDTVKADALFREGQALMAKGDYTAACLRLADSYALDPALGSLLNLAFCHEKQGRLFTAFSEYARAEQQAQRSEQSERASFAASHKAEVGAKLPRARLVLGGSPSKTKIVALRIDGQPYDGPVEQTFVVPPGSHELAIELSDGRRRTLRATFPTAAGSITDVALEEGGGGEVAKPQTLTHAPEGESGSTTRTIGFVVGGAGIVALGVGTYFGIATFSQKDEAAKGCVPAGCTPDAKREGDLAHDFATLSTVFIVTGALATAAGVYLVLSAPPSSTAAPASGRASAGVYVSPAGAGVRGSF